MSLFNLTSKQKQVFDFIKDYISKNRRSPYLREIQEACRISSHKGVIDKLLSLERKGLIRRKLNKHRGIKLNARRYDL